MNTKISILLSIIVSLFISTLSFATSTVKLPVPQINASFPLDQAIYERRSVRNFKTQNVTLNQLSQLLWAAQGITEPRRKLHTAPSAGALYPLDLYIVKNDGVWQYVPKKHALKLVMEGDVRGQLSAAALDQTMPKDAPINVVIIANYNKITPKYGERGIMFAHIEAGHIAQNLMLEAVALGLVSVPIGGFDPTKTNQLFSLSPQQAVLYIIPLGYKK